MGRETNKSRREAQAKTAREKAAAARNEAKRAEQRKRALAVISSVVVVVVAAVVIFFVAGSHKSNQTVVAADSSAAASVVKTVSDVSSATLDSVGAGSIIAAPSSITGTPLVSGGKPELLYIGAEFCPYCAGERWAMAQALSRFGTLHGVEFTKSSSDDVDPNTSTLDFKNTTYDSKYLTFTPVENEDRNHNTLQKVTAQQNQLWGQYSPNGQKGFPFLDFGNKYVISGPSFDPKVLAGLTQQEIASKLSDPSDPVAMGVDGAANLITATICDMTNNKPASVCSSSTISTIQGQIQSAAKTSSSGSKS